jgi:hypothetical protein
MIGAQTNRVAAADAATADWQKCSKVGVVGGSKGDGGLRAHWHSRPPPIPHLAIEMSQSKWLVAAIVPGVKRQPLKKLQADEEALLKLLYRWRTEAGQTGREIKRVVVALIP